MPCRKVPMRLIEKALARAETHARRTKGLQKKASELATLCAVPVALVCSAGAGAPPLVWESEEGVLERYRRAVPAETRARHTHRCYMETELGKERAKLARTRHGCPGALADWDAALNDMTLEEARGLLETIDTVLRATGDRMEALGIPADGGHGPLQGSSHGALMPQKLGHGGGNPVDMDAAGFQQLQMVSFHAGNNEGLLEQFSWDDPFQTQPGCGGFQCVGGNYSAGGDAMLSPGVANADYNYSAGGDEMLTLDLANADYNYSAGGDEMLTLGLANADYNYSGGSDEMLAPAFVNADYNNSSSGGEMLAPGFGNADYDWTDLTMWANDELCDAVMTHGCYPDFADGTLPPHYSAQVITGGDYVNTPPPGGYGYPMAMGVGDNFTNLDRDYTAHSQFQRFDTSSLLLGAMQS
ncbi:hypothetical protein CFC21_104087 [Triticum aestivum]|uniref:MADS-box domain-containing protein n=2 Tax=Triticum aestivum TaxID=4565 RepID=A0A9R1M997_WHEAT|nr:uncharacterized protein LOC123162211 [Triticum aestivum]KAF7103054.1 hypothetical protein CFC21_104087 [Triticum aestivum]